MAPTSQTLFPFDSRAIFKRTVYVGNTCLNGRWLYNKILWSLHNLCDRLILILRTLVFSLPASQPTPPRRIPLIPTPPALRMREDVMRALAQVRVVIASMTAVAIIYFRSVHVCYIALGGCIAAIVAKTLKIIIRQPRPAPLSKSVLPQAKGYGMPSSHSLVSAYFGVYLQALLLYGSQHPLFTLVSIIVVNGFCCSVYLSRVHLGNHSPAQVTVGGILGSFIALFWYWQWLKTFAPWLQIHGQETMQNLFIYFGLNPSLQDYIYLH